MKRIEIKKVFTTIDELNGSEEFKQLWLGFQMEKERNYPDLPMIKAYLGDDGNLYTIREVSRGKEKGLRFLGQCTVGSCLHTKPFHMGLIVNDEFILINDEKHYDRCKENRVKLAGILKDQPENFVTTL